MCEIECKFLKVRFLGLCKLCVLCDYKEQKKEYPINTFLKNQALEVYFKIGSMSYAFF